MSKMTFGRCQHGVEAQQWGLECDRCDKKETDVQLTEILRRLDELEKKIK